MRPEQSRQSRQSGQSEQPERTTSFKQRTTSHQRIFVIEDAIEIRVLLKRLLEGEGYIVDGAANGREALDLLRAAAELPAVILLDLMMPVMDGYQFREEQRKDPQLANIPIVVMTADGHIETKKSRVEAIEALKKPLSATDLLDIIERYCHVDPAQTSR